MANLTSTDYDYYAADLINDRKNKTDMKQLLYAFVY